MNNKNPPQTEGIKYVGSKLKLLPNIIEIISDLSVKTIYDGFSGTTRVSQSLAKSGYKVISSDISEWSEVFGNCYLKSNLPEDYFNLIEHLNNCKPFHGWFSENYGELQKKPWQIDNLNRLDGIRSEIEKLNLTKIEESVALTSLILALDKVDNTLGHFSSYLKDWSPRSYYPLNLKVPMIQSYEQEHEILKGDIFSLAKDINSDLTYLDPPYGSNNDKMPSSRVRYSAYYPLWKTIILNDKPKLFGKVKRREDTRDNLNSSVFEEYRKDKNTGKYLAATSIQKLLKIINSSQILLSYSSTGRINKNDLFDIINDVGKLKNIYQIDYKKNVMSNMKWTKEWENNSENQEYLILIEK